MQNDTKEIFRHSVRTTE